ncbi:MAG: SDR family oxidoreductase [Nitrosopumilus sp. H8]|nr:MAG: SDR family oxidoreductase [Nitrosopumilus sp. H13]RNJ80216.1 MAG: SDR family oxidoreductase [Nitrosopumilus sp. H8]
MEKVALVTGCSSGIGLETALALARDGYDTFAGMRDTSKSAALEEAAKKEGLKVVVTEMDVDRESSIESAFKGVGGRLDVLVNNAGYMEFGCVEDVPLESFRRQFETNFFGIVKTIQEAAPIMRRQKSGTIVNVSSVVGRMGLPGSSAYISTKFALEGLSECLRYELGQFGIRTTLIEPGVVKTNFFDSMNVSEAGTDPKYKELTEHILGGLRMMVEMGTAPSQVADAIIKAVHSDEVLPRYVVGTDAAMFMEAKKNKTDAEFEKYMGKELFP